MRRITFLLLFLSAVAADSHSIKAASSDWIAAPQPPYPLTSALKKFSGVVTLRLILKNDGHVKEVKVEKQSGSERLDAAARMATLQWQLDPTKLKPTDTKEGRVVAIEFRRAEHDSDLARAVLLRAGERGSAWQRRGSIQYPSSARIFHHPEGTVLLEFTIGFDGHPRAVRILQSSGYPPFDRAAVDGIQTWKAYPPFVGESAKIPITFTLQH
jgi:TonB family protein